MERAAEAIPLLKDALSNFIEEAMVRVRRSVSLEDHAPEAVTYIATVVAVSYRSPFPTRKTPNSAMNSGRGRSSISRRPRVRGRAPIFELGQRSIASLMSDIEREVIALPDLQRPFVWEDTTARQLLNSLFVGFPVGTLVFWQTSDDKDPRVLGAERPGLRPQVWLSTVSNASRRYTP